MTLQTLYTHKSNKLTCLSFKKRSSYTSRTLLSLLYVTAKGTEFTNVQFNKHFGSDFGISLVKVSTVADFLKHD